MAYPKFKDIRIYNVPGFDPAEIQQTLVDFITDPAHEDYRWIESHVFYLNGCGISDFRYRNIWTSVAIIYTEQKVK